MGHSGPSSRAARSRPGSGATAGGHQPLRVRGRQGRGGALTVPDFRRPKNEVMAGVGVVAVLETGGRVSVWVSVRR